MELMNELIENLLKKYFFYNFLLRVTQSSSPRVLRKTLAETMQLANTIVAISIILTKMLGRPFISKLFSVATKAQSHAYPISKERELTRQILDRVKSFDDMIGLIKKNPTLPKNHFVLMLLDRERIFSVYSFSDGFVSSDQQSTLANYINTILPSMNLSEKIQLATFLQKGISNHLRSAVDLILLNKEVIASIKQEAASSTYLESLIINYVSLIALAHQYEDYDFLVNLLQKYYILGDKEKQQYFNSYSYYSLLQLCAKILENSAARTDLVLLIEEMLDHICQNLEIIVEKGDTHLITSVFESLLFVAANVQSYSGSMMSLLAKLDHEHWSKNIPLSFNCEKRMFKASKMLEDILTFKMMEEVVIERAKVMSNPKMLRFSLELLCDTSEKYFSDDFLDILEKYLKDEKNFHRVQQHLPAFKILVKKVQVNPIKGDQKSQEYRKDMKYRKDILNRFIHIEIKYQQKMKELTKDKSE